VKDPLLPALHEGTRQEASAGSRRFVRTAGSGAIGAGAEKEGPMKFVSERPYADPEAAARKLLEIANSVEAVQDGRIHIELLNAPFLYEFKGTPAEYRVGLECAIERGFLTRDGNIPVLILNIRASRWMMPSEQSSVTLQRSL
jgi:hypothetical protein